MPQLHLPVQHTDQDLALAGALASVLRSKDLYVAWSLDTGQSEPIIPAALKDSEPARTRRSFWTRLFGRTV
jgi:hypothetical protein